MIAANEKKMRRKRLIGKGQKLKQDGLIVISGSAGCITRNLAIWPCVISATWRG